MTLRSFTQLHSTNAEKLHKIEPDQYSQADIANQDILEVKDIFEAKESRGPANISQILKKLQ